MKPTMVGILKNEEPNSAQKWEKACAKYGINFITIDLTANDWLDCINSYKCDFFLLKPPGRFERFKILYDERLYIICKVLGLLTFPSYEECYIYENKKLLSYYLKARSIPHPKSFVFYHKKEALDFINNYPLPLVGKTAIGASGKGVVILRDIRSKKSYILDAFSKGLKREFGPNRVIGSPKKWLERSLQSPYFFLKKVQDYLKIYNEVQNGYVILQEYIPHDFEWRAVRIGDSYFAHKKVKYGDKASGSKGIDYVTPPHNLLDFVKELCEANHFNCMAIDLFERNNSEYLVNELQTLFGHVQGYILSINDKPGRFRYMDNSWVFEAGDFNSNESYDLRLSAALNLYSSGKL